MKGKLKLEYIDTGTIKMNDYNPNEMVQSDYEALKNEIMRVGFNDPVDLWISPEGKMTLIDGEHRYRAAVELKIPKIPAFIFEDITLPQAKLLTITKNKFRGDLNPVKFGKLVIDLDKDIENSELQKIFNMNDKELDAYRLLVNQELDMTEAPKQETFIKHYEFVITNQETANKIDQAFETIKGTENKKFITIVEFYLNSGNSGANVGAQEQPAG